MCSVAGVACAGREQHIALGAVSLLLSLSSAGAWSPSTAAIAGFLGLDTLPQLSPFCQPRCVLVKEPVLGSCLQALHVSSQ